MYTLLAYAAVLPLPKGPWGRLVGTPKPAQNKSTNNKPTNVNRCLVIIRVVFDNFLKKYNVC